MFTNKLIFILLISFCSIAYTKTILKDHLEVQLITQPKSNEKNTIEIGVHFKIEKDWHLYWLNPGDFGSEPKFELTGGVIEKVLWPYPTRLPLGDLTNFGYSDEVVYILQISKLAEVMSLQLKWLVCKVECVPGSAVFDFSLQDLRLEPDLFEKFKGRTPEIANDWQANFVEQNSSEYIFNLDYKIQDIKNLFIFPHDGENFKTNLPKIEIQNKSIQVSMPLSVNAAQNIPIAEFTFVAEKNDGSVISFSQIVTSATQPPNWWMGLLLAFLGGLILNLMPCVFPVLFIKVFSFIKESNPKKIQKSSWSYLMGVIVSFILIGGLLTLLRLSGESIGWGFQLQSPMMTFGLSILFYVMALNFYGFIEFGDSITNTAGKLGQSRFLTSDFGTGVLAVVVASPCTAPFMGTALGLTLLIPAYQSLLIFMFLGLGLAIPMVVFAYIPGLVSRLPRSGQWMILVKQFLCFPLFATSLWLLWVLLNQKGADAVFISLFSFLIITFGIWILKVSQKLFIQTLSVIFILFSAGLGFYFIHQVSKPIKQDQSSEWAPFDEKIISEKQKYQAVFIDFTAAWCITCQVNKRTVLDTPEIQEFFKSQNIYLVRADWTNQDAKITQALAKFNRNSVPFYVFYNNLSEAITLPEILTKDLIKKLILEGGNK